jgi:hypothetical protein
LGYVTHVQEYFARLSPGERTQIQREIRLGKLILQAMDGLYGSQHKAFRAHMVEQFIIQCYDYRSSGTGVGSLQNAFELLLEENTNWITSRLVQCSDLSSFRKRFPLWHPGWLRVSAGTSANDGKIDMWSLLGDGDPELAETKWKLLISLAAAMSRMHIEQQVCSITDLTQAALSIVNSIQRRSAGGFVFEWIGR